MKKAVARELASVGARKRVGTAERGSSKRKGEQPEGNKQTTQKESGLFP